MQLFILTFLAMVAFAGNSLFSRLALTTTSLDPASFTLIRILSGAVFLSIFLGLKSPKSLKEGTWISAFLLFLYAATFSFAYTTLETGVGALILFGAVQGTMIGYGVWRGEKINKNQSFGLIISIIGVVTVFTPGLTAPPIMGSLLMLISGLAWACYSILGKNTENPTAMTAGNFIRAVPFALLLFTILGSFESLDTLGMSYAFLSGALASGVGYALWYASLRKLNTTVAASVQLSVPALAGFAGIIFLDEVLSLGFALSSIAILGGIWIFVTSKNRS